jgi:hypothetical protein
MSDLHMPLDESAAAAFDTAMSTMASETGARVTMMTIVSKLGEFDCDAIASRLEERIDGDSCDIRLDASTVVALDPSTAFHNSMMFRYRTSAGARSIKVFRNGSVQMTGFREATDAYRTLCRFADAMGVDWPATVSVCLANAILPSRSSPRDGLFTHIRAHVDGGWRAVCNSERYRGMRIRTGDGTLLVTRRGCVTASGFVTIADMSAALITLGRTIDDFFRAGA